jgi:hypothetical protein
MKRERRREKRVNEDFGGWGIAQNIGALRKSLAGDGHLGRSVTPRALGTEFASVFNAAGAKAPMQQKRDMGLLADYLVGQLMTLDQSKFRRVMTELIRTLARELTRLKESNDKTSRRGSNVEKTLAEGRFTEEGLREAIRSDLLTEKKRLLNEDVMAALKELIMAFADSIRKGEVPESVGTPQTRAVVNKSVATAEKALKASGLSTQTTEKFGALITAISSYSLAADEMGKEGLGAKMITGFTNTTMNALKQLLQAKAKKEEAEKARLPQTPEQGPQEKKPGDKPATPGEDPKNSKPRGADPA